MEPVRRTTSSEGAGFEFGGLGVDQLVFSDDDGSPEFAIHASSSPNLFASRSFLSDVTNTAATTNNCLGEPNITIASEGARDYFDSDALDLLSNGNPFRQVATIAPRSPSLSPALTSSERTGLDCGGLDQLLLSGDRISPNLSASASDIFSDAPTTTETTNSITMASGGGTLLDELFSGNNPWLQVATIASSSTSCFACPSIFPGEPKRQRVPALREVITEVMRKSSIEKLFSSIEPLIRRVAVDVLTTDVSTIPRTKFNGASYIDASPEILQVLRAACIIHNLPLAQTWATCAQQGKRCRHHSDENYRYCISTIDAACYVNDPRMQIFHEACSEHHLLPRQGVAGKAFTTNQPCFLPDIGSSSEQEYPLCHHAKIFKLKGAVAIRLRCTRAGMADFVLEFFLPTDCGVLEEQKAVLDTLWGTVRSLSRTLRMVTDKEMDDDAVREMNKINSLGLQKNKKPMKRKRMARRSPAWNDFTEVMVGDTVKAKCNHCSLELCCDSKAHGTSSLKSHLERCKLNPNNRIAGPL